MRRAQMRLFTLVKVSVLLMSGDVAHAASDAASLPATRAPSRARVHQTATIGGLALDGGFDSAADAVVFAGPWALQRSSSELRMRVARQNRDALSLLAVYIIQILVGSMQSLLRMKFYMLSINCGTQSTSDKRALYAGMGKPRSSRTQTFWPAQGAASTPY